MAVERLRYFDTDPAKTAATAGRSTATEQPFLSLDGINHTYRTADGPVVRDIDLDVRGGEILALIGRSGSGKSTLLHIAAGLMRPSEGRVMIKGEAVTGPSPRWVMMFQSPSLFPWMTVAENAALGLRYTGQRTRAATRVPQVLEMVDLTAFADRNVQDLSGGQQQRVALARSLAPEPDMLLLDEPFSALDLFTRRALQRDVRRIAQEFGLTVVLVTHDIAEAVVMADRAVFLSSGPGRIAETTRIERAVNDAPIGQEEARLSEVYTRIADISKPSDDPTARTDR